MYRTLQSLTANGYIYKDDISGTFQLSFKICELSSQILDRMGDATEKTASDSVRPVLAPAQIVDLQALVRQLYADERLKGYLVELVAATRDPRAYGLPELAVIEALEDGWMAVGSGATFSQVMDSPLVRAHAPAESSARKVVPARGKK